MTREDLIEELEYLRDQEEAWECMLDNDNYDKEFVAKMMRIYFRLRVRTERMLSETK